MYNTSNFQTTTHALGGGEWSIEVTLDGSFVKEFVGNNGTQQGEEADDLWSEYNEWVSSLPDNPDLLYTVSWERSRRSEKGRYCPVVSSEGIYTWSQAYDECVRLNLEIDALNSIHFKEV